MGIQKFDAASYLFLKMLISQLIFEADKHFILKCKIFTKFWGGTTLHFYMLISF